MQVQVVHRRDYKPCQAELCVVIDVLRAFSVSCYAFHGGARRIIAVRSPEAAFEYRDVLPDERNLVLLGERNSKQPEGFDYGNSPSEIENVDFSAKTVVHTSSNGIQGLLNAHDCQDIVVGSFVNARAVASYIKERAPKSLVLINTAVGREEHADEDVLCAEYILSLLRGEPIEHDEIYQTMLAAESTQRFFDPVKTWLPERDFELCMRFDVFDFVVRARTRGEEQMELEPVTVKG